MTDRFTQRMNTLGDRALAFWRAVGLVVIPPILVMLTSLALWTPALRTSEVVWSALLGMAGLLGSSLITLRRNGS